MCQGSLFRPFKHVLLKLAALSFNNNLMKTFKKKKICEHIMLLKQVPFNLIQFTFNTMFLVSTNDNFSRNFTAALHNLLSLLHRV